MFCSNRTVAVRCFTSEHYSELFDVKPPKIRAFTHNLSSDQGQVALNTRVRDEIFIQMNHRKKARKINRLFVMCFIVLAANPTHTATSEPEIRGSGEFKFSVEWLDGEIVQQDLGIGLKKIPFGSSLDDLLQDGFSCTPMVHDPKLHKCRKSSPEMTFLGQPAKGITFARDAVPIDYAVIETKIPHSQIRKALTAKYEANPFIQTQGFGKNFSEKYSSFYWVFADRGVIELEVDGSSPFADRIRLYSSTSSDQNRYLFAREALKELSPELELDDL